jgi:hypothetical protein
LWCCMIMRRGEWSTTEDALLPETTLYALLCARGMGPGPRRAPILRYEAWLKDREGREKDGEDTSPS